MRTPIADLNHGDRVNGRFGRCGYCRTPFIVEPAGGWSRFCTDECRHRNRHKDRPRPDVKPETELPHAGGDVDAISVAIASDARWCYWCGTEISGQGERFCSKACHQALESALRTWAWERYRQGLVSRAELLFGTG